MAIGNNYGTGGAMAKLDAFTQKPTYVAQTGDYTQSSYGWNGSNASNNVTAGNQNQSMSWDGKAIGGNTGGMSTLDGLNLGLNTAMGAASLVSTFQQNKLAKDTFRYNKKNMERNYKLARDAYDTRIRRSRNIERQLGGESYESVANNDRKPKADRDQTLKDI